MAALGLTPRGHLKYPVHLDRKTTVWDRLLVLTWPTPDLPRDLLDMASSRGYKHQGANKGVAGFALG
jgi:hypothetical protein